MCDTFPRSRYLPALWTHQVYTGSCDNTAINLWYRPKLALPLLLLHQVTTTQFFQRSEIVHGLLGGSDHANKANRMRVAVSSAPSGSDSDGPFAVYMTAVKKEKKEVVAAFEQVYKYSAVACGSWVYFDRSLWFQCL